MVSQTKPVRISNEIVINEILLKQILKKIPSSMYVEFGIGDGISIIIMYSSNKLKGQFTLKDISNFYGSAELPEFEIDEYLKRGAF